MITFIDVEPTFKAIRCESANAIKEKRIEKELQILFVIFDMYISAHNRVCVGWVEFSVCIV